MFKKTLAATVVGVGALLAVTAPASAGPPAPEDADVDQVGLVNLNDTVNNLCVAPWGDGQVLAVKVPLFNPQQYQACNEGKAIQG